MIYHTVATLPVSPANRGYRGRFAPTPSGPLHLGSLFAALASWLQARTAGGVWLVRIDDLDRARCIPGASTKILLQLEAHGLVWDETPRYQSEQLGDYEAALARLQALGKVYPCSCSRAELLTRSTPGPDGPIYSGRCRSGAQGGRRHSQRLRVESRRLCFDDAWQGPQCRLLEREIGDFIVARSDGVLAYQLACAVDEADQGITEVVRGADLLGSTFQQLYVQKLLGLKSANYRHLPVLVDSQGRKLSKQNHAPEITSRNATQNLLRCLSYLRQEPPSELRKYPPVDILDWARHHWTPARLAGLCNFAVED